MRRSSLRSLTELLGLAILVVAFTPLTVRADDFERLIQLLRETLQPSTGELSLVQPPGAGQQVHAEPQVEQAPVADVEELGEIIEVEVDQAVEAAPLLFAEEAQIEEGFFVEDAPAADPFGEPAIQLVQKAARPARAAVEGEEAPTETPAEGEKPAVESTEEATVSRPAAPPANPRVVRFHLMDGSMISGELTIDEITVATEFGKLVVPIPQLTSFTPGLDSYPKISGEIDQLIEKLGSDDYQTRELAHKDLSRLGLKVRPQLLAKKDDENAERKRHVDLLLKESEALAEEQAELAAEGEEAPATEWIRDDTIVTGKFTMVGKISPQEFVITSKYGPLNVKLSDVRLLDRENVGREAIQRRIEVSGTNLAQMSYKETGIRLEVGDKVTISADGQLVMSPWGNNMSSSPEGGQNFGWYVPNKIAGGALIGKIGNSSEEFKIGSKYTFTAKRSGVLKLAIAMQAQYAQQGYNFPGQYNVRVKVEGP